MIGLEHSLTFDVRAVAVAVAAIRETFQDEGAVPIGVAVRDVRDTLSRIVALRTNDGNVDGKLLPTAACASVLEHLREDIEARTLTEWLTTGSPSPLDAAEPPEAAQVLLWVYGVRSETRLAAWLGAYANDERVSRSYRRAIAYLHARCRDDGKVDEQASALAEVVADESTDPLIQAEIILALLDLQEPPLVQLVLASRVLRERLATLRRHGGSIELNCLISAALIKLEGHEELASRSIERHLSRDEAINVRELTELRTALERQEQETVRRGAATEEATARSDRLRWVSRLAVATGLTFFVVAVAAVVVSLVLETDVEDTWVLSGAFTVVLAVGGSVLRRAHKEGVF
jgi:hypothetical protein